MTKNYKEYSYVILSLGLGACNPYLDPHGSFEVEGTHDKFRETSMCTTKNNYVETEGVLVLFDLVTGKGTEGIQEYFFTIDINNRIFGNSLYFMGDYIILNIDNGRPIKLKLSFRATGETINLSNNRYAKSVVVPFEVMRDLVKAKSIKFELELRDNKKPSLIGEFSQKNREQLQKFQQVCMIK